MLKLYCFCLSVTHFSSSLQKHTNWLSYTSWAYILIKRWLPPVSLHQNNQKRRKWNISKKIFQPLKAVNRKTWFSGLYWDFCDNKNCFYEAWGMGFMNFWHMFIILDIVDYFQHLNSALGTNKSTNKNLL